MREDGTLDPTSSAAIYLDEATAVAETLGPVLAGHKAQGSQWDNVVPFDESACFREDRRRWLYTGLTRAAQEITVVTA